MPDLMNAMVLERVGGAVVARRVELPRPGPGQVLLRVEACGVCRTDLHIQAGELSHPKLPLSSATRSWASWRSRTPVRAGSRSVLESASRGWGGRAERAASVGPAGRICASAPSSRATIGTAATPNTPSPTSAIVSLCPPATHTLQAAPLLCAGLIGYRSLVAAGDAARLGLYGFGAAAHIVAQVARHQGRRVFAFTRPGDDEGQRFARELGAEWAGGSDQSPPELLDAAILFAPVGPLVPDALRVVDKGGGWSAPASTCRHTLVSIRCLWGERSVRSVANLTRRDGEEFFRIADQTALDISAERFPLSEANSALSRLRAGEVRGAAVLAGSGGRRRRKGVKAVGTVIAVNRKGGRSLCGPRLAGGRLSLFSPYHLDRPHRPTAFTPFRLKNLSFSSAPALHTAAG